MKNKHALLFSVLLVLFGLVAFIPRNEEDIEKLVASFQRWTEANPKERIHLHLDKPYYALGDTIWFKAYVTVGSRRQLSAMSGALYVELMDGKDSIVRSLRLPVVTGTTFGDFLLEEGLAPGNFRIRAYTQWMRNAGEDHFYDQTFMVGSLGTSEGTSNQEIVSAARSRKNKNAEPEHNAVPALPDIQFFPESGSLVNGIASRIGFKATGTDGKGLTVKGVIIDDLDKEIIDFKSLYAGMGSVVLKPEAGRTYYAQVTIPDGSVQKVNLPKALDNGYVLSIYQPVKDSILVRINTTSAITQQNPRHVNLFVQSGGEVIYAAPVKLSRPIASIWLHKALFPSGIAQFTLFNDKNEPINERIAFVRAQDRMELKISSAKQTYRSREPVSLNLTAGNSEGKSTAGTFSVSVIDERKVNFNDSLGYSIFSNLLLSADLRGHIENPNYYFNKETEEVNDALDNLMLTQGYRRFDWKAVNADSLARPLFPIEGLGTTLSGQLLGLNGKPQPNSSVTLVSLKANLIQNSKTDVEGRFKFEGLVLTDSIRMTLQARNEKKSTKVELVLDSVPKIGNAKPRSKVGLAGSIERMLDSYIDHSRKIDSIYYKVGLSDRVRRLREVNITGRKTEQKYFSQGAMTTPSGHADLTIDMKNEKVFASMESFIREKLSGRGIRFQSFRPDKYGPEAMSYPWAYDPILRELAPMKIIVDGRRLDATDAIDVIVNSSIEPADIAKIDVVVSNLALASMLGGPAIVFYTKIDKFVRKPELNVLNITPRGFNKVKSFFAPKYDRPASSQLPDLRSTIYWNPNVKTYASGKTSINFFNADGPGSYKVVVEGINENGELGRAVYRYEVEAAANVVHASVDRTNNIVASLDSLQKRMPVEKVYLHTDKPYYNLGDTLWFKSYLLNAADFTGSTRTGLLYVELVDDSTEVVRRISVPVSNGLGWAQIPLSTKIFHEGGYTLRAYTNWMQNFGAEYIFSRRLHLGKPSINTWLVQSDARVRSVNNQNDLEVDLKLRHADNSPVGLKDLELRIYEADKYLSKQAITTSQDGTLKISSKLREKADGRNIRVEIRNQKKEEGEQVLHVPLRIIRNERIDLQFLPEGGHLVGGLRSVVGFKAIGEDGRGINVMGKIYDSSGAEAGTFSSLHNGMGSFDFTPRPDEKYTAKILLPEPLGNTYTLPVVNKEGTILRVTNKKDSLSIQVSSTANVGMSQTLYYLIGSSRGKVYYSATVDLDKANIKLSSKLFPTGITRFTLLNGQRPLNERIVFVNHGDELEPTILAHKSTYLNRDSISLSIDLKDKGGMPMKGHFSLSVTDDSQVKPDSTGNHSMAASLLINSDLKGTVENPGYYLTGKDKEAALDHLMLTQGWTGYNWSDVFAPPSAPKYQAEKELKITGRVTNALTKPVKGAQVLISSQKPSFITTALTGDDGGYLFKNLPQIDSGSFFIQARTAKGKTKTFGGIEVDKFQPAPIPATFRDQLLPWYVNSDPEQINYVLQTAKKNNEELIKQSGIALKEVKIVAGKVIKGSFNRNGPGKADLIFDEQDIKESAVMDLYQLIKQKIPGLKVVMEDMLPTIKLNNYIVTIEVDDGGLPVRLDPNPTVEDLKEELRQFKIAGFVGMEVMYSRKYMTRYAPPPEAKSYSSQQIIESERIVRSGEYESEDQSRSGPFYYVGFKPAGYLDARVNVLTNRPREVAVIVITTKGKAGWHRINKADVVSYRPLPLMKPQDFYSPRYSINPSDVTAPDFRSTIFWKPDVVVDSEGKANVSFYSGDIPGNYTVILEGTSSDGVIVSKRMKLRIESNKTSTK